LIITDSVGRGGRRMKIKAEEEEKGEKGEEIS
jgi:hypothetical protein